MVKKLVIGLFFLTCCFVGYNYFVFATKQNTLNFDVSIIKNGDLLLRKGRSIESYAVYISDEDSDFTHIGIITKEASKIYVIHVVPSKNNLIKKESLENFLSDKNTSSYTLYRSKYDVITLKKVVAQANVFFEKHYTFDNHYNLKTDTELYCTELIYKAFLNANINLDIKPSNFNYIVGNHDIIMPSDFINSPNFRKII